MKYHHNVTETENERPKRVHGDTAAMTLHFTRTQSATTCYGKRVHRNDFSLPVYFTNTSEGLLYT